jgi:hypothetical protein
MIETAKNVGAAANGVTDLHPIEENAGLPSQAQNAPSNTGGGKVINTTCIAY